MSILSNSHTLFIVEVIVLYRQPLFAASWMKTLHQGLPLLSSSRFPFNHTNPNLIPMLLYRCQSYEGGIGAQPGLEAHGGYTFCGLAALRLLGAVDMINGPAALVHTET